MLYTPSNTIGQGLRATVTLDGKVVADVFEADDEESYLVRYKRDEAGRHVLEGEHVATERLDGVVQVTLEPME